jgi:hypothetical protein
MQHEEASGAQQSGDREPPERVLQRQKFGKKGGGEIRVTVKMGRPQMEQRFTVREVQLTAAALKAGKGLGDEGLPNTGWQGTSASCRSSDTR